MPQVEALQDRNLPIVASQITGEGLHTVPTGQATRGSWPDWDTGSARLHL